MQVICYMLLCRCNLFFFFCHPTTNNRVVVSLSDVYFSKLADICQALKMLVAFPTSFCPCVPSEDTATFMKLSQNNKQEVAP